LARRGLTGQSLYSEDGDSVFPERFELIELALMGRQHVNYHCSVVGQEPSRTNPLLVKSANIAGFKSIEDGFPYGIELALTVAGANEEIVREGAGASHVEQCHIDCLLL